MQPQLLSLANRLQIDPATLTTWQTLLDRGIEPTFLGLWLDGVENRQELELLTDVLRRLLDCGKSQSDLNRWIDDSPYSVQAWAEATLTLFKRKGEDIAPDQTAFAFGYLTCCAETGSYLPNLESFQEIVEQMLNFYGYEGKPGDHRSSGSDA